MLRQTRFNNFVSKATYEEIWPQWDDEVEDVKVDNIIRAFYCEFGTWSFNDEHFPDKRVKVSNVVKLESVEAVEGSGKKVVDGGELAAVAQAMKGHMDECFTTFSGTITKKINRCESLIKDLCQRVSTLDNSVKATETSVTEVVKEVKSLGKVSGKREQVEEIEKEKEATEKVKNGDKGGKEEEHTGKVKDKRPKKDQGKKKGQKEE